MPLSEEELRLLEQMERALVEEDPKFASALRGTTFRRNARRRAVVAAVVFVLGVCGLMAGAILSEPLLGPLLGIAGFLVMLASAVVGLSALRGQSRNSGSPEPGAGQSRLRVIDGGRLRSRRPGRQPGHPSGGGGGGSFMDRMEERWRRRRENGS